MVRKARLLHMRDALCLVPWTGWQEARSSACELPREVVDPSMGARRLW